MRIQAPGPKLGGLRTRGIRKPIGGIRLPSIPKYPRMPAMGKNLGIGKLKIK